MGKYDHVIEDLRPEPVDASWQTRVNAEKDVIRDELKLPPRTVIQPDVLASLYAVARASKDVLKAQLNMIECRICALEQLLASSQERRDDGWGKYGVKDNALRMEDGSTIRVNAEPTVKVTDHEAFRLWCIANGYEKKLRLMHQTTESLVKERLLTGDREPDGVEVFSRKSITYIPAKDQ